MADQSPDQTGVRDPIRDPMRGDVLLHQFSGVVYVRFVDRGTDVVTVGYSLTGIEGGEGDEQILLSNWMFWHLELSNVIRRGESLKPPSPGSAAPSTPTPSNQ